MEILASSFQKNNRVSIATGWHRISRHLVEQPIFLVVVTVGVRLPVLWLPLWYDEAFTRWLVSLPVSQLVAATAGDVHPPLFYLTAWLSARVFGINAFAIRFPALVFGSMSVVMFGAILSELKLAPTVKTITLWLTALSPFLAYYSAEGRMYAMLLFFVLTATYGVLRGELWLFVAGTIFGLYTHNMMALYVPFLGALFMIKTGWTKTLKAATLVLVFYIVLWMGTLARQLAVVKNGFWVAPLTIGRVIAAIYEATAEVASNADTVLITVVVVLLLLAIGTVVAIKQREWTLLGLAFLPIILAVLISIFFRPIITTPPRILIGSTPFLILLLTLGAHRLHRHAGQVTWSLSVVALVLLGNLFVAPNKHAPTYAALNITGTCYHMEPTSIVVASVFAPGCNSFGWENLGGLNLSLTPQTVSAMGIENKTFEELPAGDVYLFFSDVPFTSDEEYAEIDRILNTYEHEEISVSSDFGIVKSYLYRIRK